MSQEETPGAFISKTPASKTPASKTAAEAHARQLEVETPIAVWALGETRAMSDRERRLTAAVYAQIPGVLDHVREQGRVPRSRWLPGGGPEAKLRSLVQRRGLDLELSEAERMVYGAIGAEGDAPAGRAVLIARRRPRSPG
jgi:hypothetical protein